MLIIIHSGVLYLRKIITIMDESPSDKIHKTFRDDLLSNIFEAKNDYLGTPEWLAKPFLLPPNLELANTLARIETSQSIASPNPTFIELATSGVSAASAIEHRLDSFTGIEIPNPFSSARFATGNSFVQSAIDQTIDNSNPTLIELATSGVSAASTINLGLESSTRIDPNLFSSAILATTGNSLVQSMIDQSIASPNSTFADFTPQILTEFEPQNYIHEEQDKKIEKLENKFSKFVTQVRKLSKKFDDLRNDTHNSIEYMAKQFDILANDVDVLTALVEDDEKE